MNYISYSLWGKVPAYLQGALHNIELAPKIYPGWMPVCFYDATVPNAFLKELKTRGCRLEQRPKSVGSSGMFWRYEAAYLKDAEKVIFRDADSLISDREAEAVYDWIKCAKEYHIMRDHPNHNQPIMGGMWGCCAQSIQQLRRKIESWKARSSYQDDQRMLEYVVYPYAIKSAIIHSEFLRFEGEEVRPFPSKRFGSAFVGMSTLREDKPEYSAIGREHNFCMISRPTPLNIFRRIKLVLRGTYAWEIVCRTRKRISYLER